MKKIYALFLALMVSALSFAALNPYAYALSSQLSADETTLTVNYSLNADATEVNVVILNGETAVKTIPCTGITKGAYTIEIPTTDFPKSTNLTWRVDVTGNSVATPTIQTNKYSFYLPRGLDVDIDTESEWFGRFYVIEADNTIKGTAGYHSTDIGQGLYVFGADLNPIANKDGKYGFTGGKVFTATENFSRVITSGGRVFVSNFSEENASPILEVNPSDLNANFTDVFTTIKGKNICIDAKGSGENLKLVALTTSTRDIVEYDLGAAKTFTAEAPSRTYTKADLTTGKALSLVTDNAYISYDNVDGIWLTQHRATATTTEPTVAHVIASGVDYNNFNAGLSHNSTSNGGVSISPDGKLLAVVGAGTKKLTIYSVSRDANGAISLTQKYTISTAGSNHTALSWDYAGNLYVANRSAETITFYAMPYDGEVATPAASKYAFQLKEEVQGTFYDLTVNCDETKGKVTGNNGQYLEGTTATLTATANRGYKFTSWTVGEETVTENPLTITVNANTTVTANFEALAAYTITAAANDATMGIVEGAGTYYAGETVTLKAVANDGHHFVNWSNEAITETITFEAAEDTTLTANFAKNIYTLTVNVNDSEKGSVDKATATYEFGTEVTLTATPAAGCELLAWSDRSTNQTFTVTIDADKAVTAYFVTSYVNEPEFKVEKVWEYTTDFPGTGNGYQAVGRDGVIYVQDAGNSKIKTITAEGITEYANSGVGQQIAIDNVGNLIVLNHTFYNTPTNVLIYKKGETEGKAVAFALKNPARCDFFSASGDIFSAEGGYIYFYCNGKTVVNRLKITNGAVAAEDVTTDVVGNITAANNNQNHVMVDIWGNLVAHARSTALNSIDVATNISKAFTLPQFKISTVGGCSFELAGKEFWAYNFGTINYNSEWSLYNMTDAKAIADTTFYTKDRTSTNSAANWLNVQVVDEKTAYIYQFCPKVGAAVWKVTANFPKPTTPEIVFNEELATITINAVESGAVIYYDWTIDATVALDEDAKYIEPIALDPSTAATYQIEALAVLDGEMSDIATATFEIKANGDAVNLESVGALAVVYSTIGKLNVQTQVGTMIEVYNLHGQCLFTGEATTELTSISIEEKVVVVRVADQVLKVVIK